MTRFPDTRLPWAAIIYSSFAICFLLLFAIDPDVNHVIRYVAIAWVIISYICVIKGSNRGILYLSSYRKIAAILALQILLVVFPLLACLIYGLVITQASVWYTYLVTLPPAAQGVYLTIPTAIVFVSFFE